MAAIENQILFLSYIIAAAVLGIVFGIRRIFVLEEKIIGLEKRIIDMHTSHRKTSKKKSTKRKKK